MIKEVKQLKKRIELAFNQNDYENLKKLLKSYPIKNEFYYIARANYNYCKGEINKGIEVLQESLQKFSNSFEIHFNLATLFAAKEQYNDAILTYARAVKLASNKEDKDEALTKINDLLQVLELDIKNSKSELQKVAHNAQLIINEFDDRIFPLTRNNDSIIRKVDNGELVNLYRTFNTIENIDETSRFFFKTELFKGQSTKEQVFKIEKPSIVPISFIDGVSKVIVNTPTNQFKYNIGTLDKNHYHYLRFDEPGQYKIVTDTPIFVGNVLSLENEPQKVKLAINIFIDGLSGAFLKEHMEEYMPRTAEYFKKGFINTNCYTTGDWTYPSVSSLLTGKTTLNHARHHPTNFFDFTKYNRIFFEDIRENGYITGQFNNNWRMTPTYGYSEGMDRLVYQNFLGGFAAGEVLSEAIEHIETFKNASQYLWISLTDLHDVADEINDNFMSQANTHSQYFQEKKKGVTSVQSKYDENKIERYIQEMKRLDLHLSMLYNYLNTNYRLDEIVLMLFSDHGQTYFSEEEFLLHEYRTNIPFMAVGKNVPQKTSNELCSIVDIFPTLLQILGIGNDGNEGKVLKDFDGEGRKYVITETIHPNQPYLVTLKTEDVEYRFKTIDNVDGNCRVDLEHFDFWAIDRYSGQIMENKDNKCLDYIIERAAILQR
ncbi:DUF229 domain-containing protein [Lysinibacillus mangiferihumi]|uniref:DUF229 domain-containing protein n=1 Tax=Lysinibacillus mangiferihumi TaxID=1130819 RepID=A0A4U2ZE99_9BACI|nr:sulfatase-like hydrolase/transferase [Lysinibacillus mangiferihumi]TKI72837.1 DUF229 domain-containing protein [Lysinibacillus mangiferihumi]